MLDMFRCEFVFVEFACYVDFGVLIVVHLACVLYEKLEDRCYHPAVL